MKKKEQLKNRVNFLYYEENMNQEEIGKILKLSRQRVSTILNSNKDHKIRKLKRIEDKKIYRKIQFYNNSSPKISIPKDMLNKIGINDDNRIAEIKVEGQSIVIKRKREQ